MRHKILVVDDTREIREFVADVLKIWGYEVSTAVDGYGAVDQFELDKPDMLITDLMMPRMDGYELCQIIRRSSSVPIVVMTALRGDEGAFEAFKAGADAFVPKPIDLGGFQIQVGALLTGTDPTAPKGGEVPAN
jgi:DNA-binding response OmpR family regulator